MGEYLQRETHEADLKCQLELYFGNKKKCFIRTMHFLSDLAKDSFLAKTMKVSFHDEYFLYIRAFLSDLAKDGIPWQKK